MWYPTHAYESDSSSLHPSGSHHLIDLLNSSIIRLTMATIRGRVDTTFVPARGTRPEQAGTDAPVSRSALNPAPAAPKEAAVEARSLAEGAYAEIKRRILSNEYPGGFQILEDALCEELGMSRTPLREGLLRLQNDGLVELLPRRGMRVLPLNADDIADIYEVISALELLAARTLASQADNAGPVSRLQAEVIEMERALDRDDLDGWAVADERFHRILADESGNPRLATAARTLLDQSQRFRIFTLRMREKPTGSTRSHRRLVEAIQRHDADEAVGCHAAHRKNWEQNMYGLMRRFGIRQI